jgi:hypothetical protein
MSSGGFQPQRALEGHGTHAPAAHATSILKHAILRVDDVAVRNVVAAFGLILAQTHEAERIACDGVPVRLFRKRI